MAKRGGSKGTKTWDPPVSLVIDAIKNSNGILSAVAYKLDVARQTLYNYLGRHPEAKACLEDERENFDDYAEKKLFELIKNGDPQTIRFYAETRLRNRGYSRKVESEINSNQPIVVQLDVDKNWG